MSDDLFSFTEADWRRVELMSAAVSRYRTPSAESTSSQNDSGDWEALRIERHRSWVLAAAASLLDRPSAKQICAFWTSVADRILTNSFLTKFPEKTALFALGKLGSGELNLSSDVDLLIVSETPLEGMPLRSFQRELADVTANGFVFRLDFDLRPGGRFGPIIPTVDQLIDYYGSYGETWEKMAFVRLRPLCGDEGIIESVQSFAQKFSYRRHLDFNLLDDLRSLRSRIQHEQKNERDELNLKLSCGGIRDIELFVHALQIVHGGKDPDLRCHGTGEAIQRLSEKGVLPSGDSEFLINLYWDLRRLENHAQAFEDRQTHGLRLTDDSPADLWEIALGLSERMDHCDRMVSTLIGSPTPAESTTISTKGLEHLETCIGEIMAIPVLSRNRERDERLKGEVVRKFLSHLDGDPLRSENALTTFRDFLKAVRAKSAFFALLVREEKLLRDLAWLFGASSYLGRLLCFRPELLDSFIFRTQEFPEDDMGLVLENLAERRLLTEILGGMAFLRDRDVEKAQLNLTRTADEVIESLRRTLAREIPSEVRVLALGKWGAQELGFRSDLDMIFVVSTDATEADLKMAKRLISRLTEAHRGGSIYPIDMRLRPSGKAGPLVICESEVSAYLATKAAPWERQAYLRSRWVDGNPCLFAEICRERGLQESDLKELNRIRAELTRTARGGLDLKLDEGGLLDIELCAQTLILVHRELPPSLKTREIITYFGHPSLADIYNSLRQIEQTIQLISAESRSDFDKNSESSQTVASILGHESPELLHQHASELLREALSLLSNLDPRRT